MIFSISFFRLWSYFLVLVPQFNNCEMKIIYLGDTLVEFMLINLY